MKYQSHFKSVYRKKSKLRYYILIILLVVATLYCYNVYDDIEGSKTPTEDIAITIPSGATSREIANLLKENDIIKYPFAFEIFARTSKNKFQLGEHNLKKSMSYEDIIKAITQTGAVENAVKIVIPEGFEVGQISDEIAKKGLATKDEFMASLEKSEFDYKFLSGIKRKDNKYEGYLFPATYTFSKGISTDDIIRAMFNKFDSVFTEEYYNRAKELDMTVDEVVTLASIIEREAATEKEFDTVSSVFHNRLDTKMALESCATVQYILKERKTVLSIADTKIKSPYNTYMNRGLPLGPIASPGEAAIKAALYPKTTDYKFFVAKPDGSGHIFSKTFEEHQAAMNSVGL